MEKTSKELLKKIVNSQQFTGATEIMNSMKQFIKYVHQPVMSVIKTSKQLWQT